MALEGDRKPVPFLQTPFDKMQGQFSPGPTGTQRWIAYVSDESGRYEVYVQPFPGAPSGSIGKFQVSIGGGSQPRCAGMERRSSTLLRTEK